MYQMFASDQHEIQSKLMPRRGTIYVQDRRDQTMFPVAKDRDAWFVYAMPREMGDTQEKTQNAKELALLLSLHEELLIARFTGPTTTYQVIMRDVPLETVDALRSKRLSGVGVAKSTARLYPEDGLGGHYLGFVRSDEANGREGFYGVEGYLNELLSGHPGKIIAEKDAAGRRLTIGTFELDEAKDGSDVVLTIDRNIQYKACETITRAVKTYEAVAGSVVIMDPKTGEILGMCSAPDFDPARYREIDHLSVLNNPALFYTYEPGSIFKPLTMAAGLDAEKIHPLSTYTDTGEERIDDFTIRNSDKQAHGVRTMTQVLEESLNTGTIHVQRLLGKDVFRDYVTQFGFGEKTEIELLSEVKGDVSPLKRKGKVFAATASFGQGISVTPIQMVTAFAALGNGGDLVRPTIIREIIHTDGSREIRRPQIIRRVVSTRASKLVSAMMVNVVENGHGKPARVPGYYIAGKTGTAQVPKTNGAGYEEDATIGSFAGYAPAQDPRFVMLIKLDRPKTVRFAEQSAAPVFGEMAAYLLSYLEVPPERNH